MPVQLLAANEKKNAHQDAATVVRTFVSGGSVLCSTYTALSKKLRVPRKETGTDALVIVKALSGYTSQMHLCSEL